MKIQVTQDHITEGKPNECDSDLCPLALAVKSAGFEKIAYDFHARSWGAKKGNAIYLFPLEIQKWHGKLLADKSVSPITFELEVP